MKKLIFALLAGLLLTGCFKDKPVTYSSIEAGTIDSGFFMSDYGKKMYIVGNEHEFDISTARRVLIQYETHPITDPDHIDIDLLGLLDAGILLPDPVESLPDVPDGSSLQVSNAWFSPYHMNVLASFAGNDSALHSITASYTVGQDGIIIRLTHDGSQDSGGTKTLNAFLAMPFTDIIAAYEQYSRSIGQKQPVYPAPVRLQWTDYALEESGPLTLFETNGTYTPPSAE